VKTKYTWVLGSLLVGALSIAATAPVAIRVEVEPLRQAGGNTEVAIIVQIAPMDRGRIGSNAIVRIELDEGRVSSGSPMRAVSVEDDGSFRVVVEWPPGEHGLRVGVEDPNKEDTGLWVGTVRIPDLSGSAVTAESEKPVPVPVPVPVPDSSRRSPEAKPEPEPEPEAVGPPAAELRPEPEMPEPPTAEPEPVPEPELVEHSAASEAPAAAASAAAVAGATAEAPAATTPIEPEIAHHDSPEPAPGPEFETAEPAGVEPELEMKEPPLVEPLRADPPPQAAEPQATGPREAPDPAPRAVLVSADLAARYEQWFRAESETREFSVVMLRGREPAENLDATDLRLRIGGSEVAVEKLGGVESAPLLLGLAIDVGPGEVDGWSGMQGSLAPIVNRAVGGRGLIFVANPSGVGDWATEPGSPDRSFGSQAPVNVARLVMASLEKFEGRRGRTFLVVLTDGRSEPSKEEWQQATDSAGAAGVPVLVVALWDEEFSSRTRKSLKNLTVVSGGSLFLVQGRAQLESAADRFGRYLDGGYSIRFMPPTAAQDTVTSVSVSASDRTVDISAPKTIR
jgi:hypothetical protein